MRVTGDIDLIIDLDPVNCKNALKTLSAKGFKPLIPVDLFDFADIKTRQSWVREKGMQVFSLSATSGFPLEIDIFVEEAIPFSELYERAKVLDVENIEIRIASIDDIITLKQRAKRPIDLDDIHALELIKAHS